MSPLCCRVASFPLLRQQLPEGPTSIRAFLPRPPEAALEDVEEWVVLAEMRMEGMEGFLESVEGWGQEEPVAGHLPGTQEDQEDAVAIEKRSIPTAPHDHLHIRDRTLPGTEVDPLRTTPDLDLLLDDVARVEGAAQAMIATEVGLEVAVGFVADTIARKLQLHLDGRLEHDDT